MARGTPASDDSWQLHVDVQEADRQKRERDVRLNTVTVPKLRVLGFALVSLTVLVHNYFVFNTLGGPAWVQLNAVLALYCGISWYLLHLLYADLKKYIDLGVCFLVIDLAFDGLAIHASGGDRSWLFFLAVFRVVDQTPISQRRALGFAHLAPLSYLGVVLHVLFVEGRDIPLGPEVAKLTVIYTGSLYTAMVASHADRRTRRMTDVIRFARHLVGQLAEKSDALETSSKELRESLDRQSRLADENAALYAAAQRDRTRQQQIFDSTSDGIIFVTRDGRIEAANVRAGDLLDFDPQSVIGAELARLVSRLYTVSAGDSFLPRLQDLLDRPWTGGDGDLEQPATGRILHWIAQPACDPGGEILGLTFTFQDVTRARELVRELEEKTRLLEAARTRAENADRAKGKILTLVGQEVRTPLKEIISGLEQLALSSPDRKSTERLRGSAQWLTRMVDDLLDLSTIDSRRTLLDTAPFALRETLRDIAEPKRAQAASKGLGFFVEISDDVPCGVRGDRERLSQVLSNLLANAVRFTDRGEVRLRVGVAAALADEIVLHFAVSDTGIGIPRDRQDGIFNAFSRPDVSSAGRSAGPGLGLAIAKRIVKMMGGDLWVDSDAGRGATFRFTATFGVGPASSQPAPAVIPPPIV